MRAYNLTSNTFIHYAKFPTPAQRHVTCPNMDTLYSAAILDLSLHPMMLTIPPISSKRFYIMQIMDAY